MVVKKLVKPLSENRCNYIEADLTAYILKQYCHNFNLEKDIEDKIKKFVSDIAQIVVDMDR